MKLKRYLLLVVFIISSFYLTGCLVGNKLSYKIVLESQNSGTAIIKYYYIRSDADTKDRLEEDKYLLYEYMAKSKQFVADMKKEGREIIDRKLYLDENGKLIAEGTYKFKSLNSVENLVYDNGYYFITLQLEDSVLSTNGQVIRTANYKRIIWDEGYKTLEFEILTEPAPDNYIDMARYYKNYY
ncbi:MAG TPA: hypothetical protein PLI27_05100 [Ignavibacteriales bacterium]|nr:hypothetical protein [Ignavibacteriales bacterium]HRT97955.1 hypothetical protein [Ignavibacteriales bacterium]